MTNPPDGIEVSLNRDADMDFCHNCDVWIEASWRSKDAGPKDPICPMCNRIIWEALARTLKPVVTVERV